MFGGVQEIIDNSKYLSALNDPNAVNLDILKNMSPFDDPKVRALEQKLQQQGLLTFDTIANENTGFYLLKQFLAERHGVDKANFLKDIEAFSQMRFEKARVKVGKLIFYRYLAEKTVEDENNNNNNPFGGQHMPSVFDSIKKRNLQKRKENPPGSGRNIIGLAKNGRSPSQRIELASLTDDKEEKNRRNTQSAKALTARDRTFSSDSLFNSMLFDSKAGIDDGEEMVVGKLNAIEYYDEPANQVAESIKESKAPTDLFLPIYEKAKEQLIAQHFEAFTQSEYYRLYIRSKLLEEIHVTPEDFTIIRLLGRGGFGTVYACKKNDSGKLYAMKKINKKLIKYKKAVTMTMLERHTLALVQSRFVCNLAYAFHDKNHLYLIIDLMPGGDLKFHLTKTRGGIAQGFSERRARFHAAEILLGLEAMHQKNIIFRDLKLENVLLDDEGHCKISDLGLVALYGKKPVNHYAGTPGYIAPEVAMKIPYGPAVDIFSYGVTIYRMLSGKKPFKGHTRQDFDNAVCNEEPDYDPSIFSEEAVALLKELLQKDPLKRLGCGDMGMQAIKDHPFFSEIDWGLLEIGYQDPPFLPSKHDINANSVDDIGAEDPEAKQYNQIALDDKFKKQIQGFEYVSKQSVQHEIVCALQKQFEEKANSKQKANEAKNNNNNNNNNNNANNGVNNAANNANNNSINNNNNSNAGNNSVDQHNVAVAGGEKKGCCIML